MEQNTSNRVLNRMGARELSFKKYSTLPVEQLDAAAPRFTRVAPIVDVLCDPS